jgi:hypothetical protein
VALLGWVQFGAVVPVMLRFDLVVVNPQYFV